MTYLSALKSLVANEDGATAIEYGLIAGLISVVIIAGITTLGGNLNSGFSGLAGKVATALPAS